MVETPCAGQPDKGGEHPPQKQVLHCLSYVSTQTREFDTSALTELLEAAREHNYSAGITGLLLHRDDSFFQILEGDKATIQGLFARIAADPRHQRVEIVAEGAIEEREFPDWRMAFIELDGQDLSALPGYSDLLNNTASAKAFLQSLSRSKKLALLFSVMH